MIHIKSKLVGNLNMQMPKMKFSIFNMAHIDQPSRLNFNNIVHALKRAYV
jgi:hypothetical protein